jgi:hypothetical protein
MKMNNGLRKAMRDGFLALLAFIIIVTVYMCVDRSYSRFKDWRIGSICGVLHGQVDFVSSPIMTISFGSYREVMFFKHATVVRCVGTYLDFGMNGVLLIGSVVALGVTIGMLPIIGRRKLKNDEANQAAHDTAPKVADPSC